MTHFFVGAKYSKNASMKRVRLLPQRVRTLSVGTGCFPIASSSSSCCASSSSSLFILHQTQHRYTHTKSSDTTSPSHLPNKKTNINLASSSSKHHLSKLKRKMNQPHSTHENIFVQTKYSDLKLAGMAWGPADADVKVLALHGWVDNAGTWSRFAPLLLEKWNEGLSPSDKENPKKGVRFVSMDLPGHGHYEHRPGNVIYHNVDYIPDVISFADAMGWDSFYIFGHSLGAGVATLAACTVPSRVKGLCVVEGFGPWVAPQEKFITNLRQALQKNVEVFNSGRPVYESVEAAVERLGKNLPGLKLESLQALVARGTKEVEGGLVFLHDKKLKCSAHQRITEGMVTACLHELDCETLLFLGKEGFYYAEADLYNFSHFVDARIATVASVGKTEVKKIFISGGHHCHLDYPEEMDMTDVYGTLGVLPLEIIDSIFCKVDYRYLPWCLRVNKTWYKIFNEIIDREGKLFPRFVRVFGSEGAKSGQLRAPHGVAFLSQTQHIAVADTENNRVGVFTLEGDWVKNWPSPSPDKLRAPTIRSLRLCYPIGLAVDSEGNLLVASESGGGAVFGPNGEYEKGQVITAALAFGLDSKGTSLFCLLSDSVTVYQYDARAYTLHNTTPQPDPYMTYYMPPMRKLRSWGSTGDQDGQLKGPQGLAVDKSQDRIYIADSENHRVQVFNSDGVFLFKWGSRGTLHGHFQHPSDVAVDDSGHVFVADSHNHRVQVFDHEGNFLHKWGKEGQDISGKIGRFKYPQKLCPALIGGKRYLFVSDGQNHRIHVYQY